MLELLTEQNRDQVEILPPKSPWLEAVRLPSEHSGQSVTFHPEEASPWCLEPRGMETWWAVEQGDAILVRSSAVCGLCCLFSAAM